MIHTYETKNESGEAITGVQYAEISHEELNGLVGQLLTLIEATYTDPEQREAQKRLVKQRCREWLDNEYDSQPAFFEVHDAAKRESFIQGRAYRIDASNPDARPRIAPH